MLYENINNTYASVFDTCELLWAYDGTNYSSNLKLDISQYPLLWILVHNTLNTSNDSKTSFLLINDPTSGYEYIICCDYNGHKYPNNRRVTIKDDGLTFSSLYGFDDPMTTDHNVEIIPYQIYGIR